MSELPAPQNSVTGTADRASADTTGDRFLHSVVVSYRGSPDQVTVYPRRDSCCDRTDAWLTVDVDAFVSPNEVC